MDGTIARGSGTAEQPHRDMHRDMLRGTRALMVALNIGYPALAPVFWFFWTARAEFRLPPWAENAAGFAAGPLPVLVFAGAWGAAGLLFLRNRRQDAGTVFTTACALGLLAAASGMLALVSAGLDG